MATFEAQVEALTSLSIDGSSTPTQNELTQFLIDGTSDVTNKWIIVNPKDAPLFGQESSVQTANGFVSGSGMLISVLRESGTTDDYRPCRAIPYALAERAKDVNSIHYVSKYNPVYYMTEKLKVNVIPSPGADPNRYKVIEINPYHSKDEGYAGLTYADDGIGYMPKKLWPYVVKYAAIKCLEAKITSYTVDDEDSELVASLGNSYNALKTEYDQIFGLSAKQTMKQQQGGAPVEQTQSAESEGEE